MVQALNAQWPDSSAVQGSERFASSTVLYATYGTSRCERML